LGREFLKFLTASSRIRSEQESTGFTTRGDALSHSRRLLRIPL
jgi:hypothetical protein